MKKVGENWEEPNVHQYKVDAPEHPVSGKEMQSVFMVCAWTLPLAGTYKA